jgi:PAS domain S-box-containing protein
MHKQHHKRNPMKKKRTQSEMRRLAEERLQKQELPGRSDPQTPEELLHELQVHQAELEMQNEELRQAQAELESAQTRYIDLFEMAPVGYLILNEKGHILEANHTAAGLLGEAKDALAKQPLTRFIMPADQDIFYIHRKQLMESSAAQVCELRMLRAAGEPFWARLESSAAQDTDGAQQWRIVMIDITMRKAMSEKLLEDENRYHELFNHISSGVAVYEAVENGRDFIFKDFNSAAEKIEKTPRQKVIGRKVTEVFPGIREMTLLETFQRVWKTGQPEHHPVSLYKDEQLVGWRENYVYKLPSGEIVAVYEDLTESKQAEEMLAHSHDLMRYIIEHNRSAVAVHDRDLKYIYVSQRYLQEYNVKEQDVIGKHHYDVFPDLPQKWRDVHQKALAGEISSAEDDPYEREDGTVDWTRWECRPWYEVDGSIGGIIVYTEIITERKRTEEALKEQRHFLRQIIDTNPARIFVRNREGTYLLVNKAEAISVGLSVEEMIGRHCTNVGDPPEMTALFMEQDQQVMDSLEGIFIPEEEGSHPDREKRWVQVSKLPLIDPDGRSSRVLVVIVDITKRKQAEARAISAQKLAGIGSLAAGMAHEINSPLQLVTGLSERLTRNLKAGEIDQQQFLTDLDRINKNGWRIANIVRSLLTYSRQSKPEMTPQDLNGIIESTLLLIEHQLKTWSNISVEKELAPDLPLVHCDSNSITQVIINLLENARDAMPGGGWIKISTARSSENGQVILRLSDSGIGIPAGSQSRIFDPFFTTKEIGEGTGLGLSIVHGIIKMLGGEITVESAPGKGTTFIIRFPKEAPLIEAPKDAPDGRYN